MALITSGCAPSKVVESSLQNVFMNLQQERQTVRGAAPTTWTAPPNRWP